MGETKKKKGLFKKVISVLSGKPQEGMKPTSEPKGKFAPSHSDPVDLVFVKNFTRSGGKFLYCENEADAYDFLNNIISEAGIQEVYCCDSALQSILSHASINHHCDNLESADAFCSNCEYLVSFNGGLMISERQTRGKKLNELPGIFIIIARTSQIVENLREGLTGIRQKYKGDIPANITTIKGPVKDSMIDTAAAGTTCTKDIFLLLLEDQI